MTEPPDSPVTPVTGAPTGIDEVVVRPTGQER